MFPPSLLHVANRLRKERSDVKELKLILFSTPLVMGTEGIISRTVGHSFLIPHKL